ncbi:MAG: glycosyltransferase [Candidatus Aenigmarchaeota archaeon]|nr:glycosyltransferase [Candidatus Aenigmarchaeota archaeon]
MKICLLTSYPPDRCGVSDYSERLVVELKKSGNEVMIISRDGERVKGEKNVERFIATKKVKRSLTQIAEELKGMDRAKKDADKTLEIINNFGADLVHIQYEPGLYNLFFVPMLLHKLKKLKIKSVVTLHAMDYFPLNVFHRTFLYRKPDKIIVHTKTHYEILRDSLPKRITGKIEMIPMGLVKEKTGKDGNYILFFGFLNQHKGVEELLNAFSKSDTKAKLLIIGSINPIYKTDVEYKNKIEGMIKSLDIGDRVKFIHDFVPSGKLENYIRDSMFVVFPYRSSYSGGQSQAILDSLVFGKPLIVTKQARGNLVDGKNAIVVNPGNVNELRDAIQRLAGSKKFRMTFSINNRKLAKELRWSNIAKLTAGVYNELLSS